MAKGLFAGSFNPFTNGHLEVVKSASKLFDVFYVCVSVNTAKALKNQISSRGELEGKIKAIDKSIKEAGISNVEVLYNIDTFTANVCAALGVEYLVRGIRGTSDYLYEENIAKINSELNPNLKTIYVRSSNDVISSTLVRELMQYGEDISKYVPMPIYELMHEKS